jgi:hypothetical protein
MQVKQVSNFAIVVVAPIQTCLDELNDLVAWHLRTCFHDFFHPSRLSVRKFKSRFGRSHNTLEICGETCSRTCKKARHKNSRHRFAIGATQLHARMINTRRMNETFSSLLSFQRM